MPRENRQRGRRGDKKRKRERDQANDLPVKRQKSSSPPEGNEIDATMDDRAGDDFVALDSKPDLTEAPFLGLLTQEDQEYYSNVNKKLTLNDFDSDEDRTNFIDAVYRESSGKELKVASSQSSSRYLEKVIAESNSSQLEALFEKFQGNFTHLIQHRFASHCCEALFLSSAAALQREMSTAKSSTSSRPKSNFEVLFLKAVDELKPNLGYLLTERFASHVLRVLIIVLSGEALDNAATGDLVASRKKEKIETMASTMRDFAGGIRNVPQSFSQVLTDTISNAISSMDTTYLRALATHPTGNPVLQLLLRLELTTDGRAKANGADSLLKRLLPDEDFDAESESAKYFSSLIYDPTGSHLVETVVQFAPGKVFKRLYKNLFKTRVGSMAKNDIAGYVTAKILERLSKENLHTAQDQILPEIPNLVARYRVNVIQVLIERCHVRNVDMKALATTLQEAYGEAGARLPKMLKLDAVPDSDQVTRTDQHGNPERVKKAKAVDLHGSLLAQAMLKSTTVCDIVQEDLLSLPGDLMILLAKDPIASRALQAALTSELSTPQFRRKLVPVFYGHAVELSTDSAGSHLVDALWAGTEGSHFQKERLAKELHAGESGLRDSIYGRTVWKNWSMDLYQRRFQDWQTLAKGLAEDRIITVGQSRKSAIEIARERYVQRQGKTARSQRRVPAIPANS